MNTKTLLGLGFASMFAVGCGAQDSTLTYEQFKASVYQEPDTGFYIYNQDEVAENEDELRAAYARYAGEELEHNSGIASKQQGLIVHRVNGVDARWSSSAALNITYCVSSSSFGSRYSTVVNAMNSATAAWEGTGARINFVHASQYDSNCTASQTGVVFDVRQTTTTSYLARAFFPNNARSARNVLISTSAFGNVSPYTLTGILRHELGHTLGFRHEHTRPEAGGVCFEDNSWRALTSYDSRSVMHYPQCNGTQTGDLVLTSLDSTGCRALYP
jgi:serralysin